MINIIKETIPLDESLKKKIEFICEFTKAKPTIIDEYHVNLKISTKEDELFDYAGVPTYLKSRRTNNKDKDEL